MAENNKSPEQKAQEFFHTAQTAADKSQFDYAIEMYIDGLRLVPDDLENGHLKLYAMALHRQGKGGSKPKLTEKIKQLHGKKTPLEQMLAAEYLFAKDPENITFTEAMLKAAVDGQFDKTAIWLADLTFQINNAAKKPSFSVYTMLMDSYIFIGKFEKALAACQKARQLKPHNSVLEEQYKHLSAEATVARGKYDQEGDFRKSIKDRHKQEKMHAQDAVVKSESYRVTTLEAARKELALNPTSSQKIFNLAHVLSDMQEDKAENEAVELLEDAFHAKNDFSFKQQAGFIKIKQFKRKIREEMENLKNHPENDQFKQNAKELVKNLDAFELNFYKLCVQNHPTDSRAKYEYALKLLKNKDFDQAIPLLQDAQKDPKYRISAMSKIGICFFKKGWFADSIDIFTRAIELYEIKDDDISKELRYNLGLAYEEQSDKQQALDIYRKIAQVDFGYKDVSQRVENLRDNT